MIELGIAIYLLLQLGVAIWASRFVTSEEDFLVAGRSLSFPLVTFSIFATWFGAETVMGSAAAIHQGGLGASRAEPFGYTICLILMATVIARKLWAGKYITIADLFRERFGVTAERLAIVIYVPATLIWASAQVKAFGIILSSATGVEVTLAISIGAGLVILYTSLGGLLGDVYTDFIQGIILILGLVVMTFVAINNLGGVEAAYATIPKENLSLLKNSESIWASLDVWMIPILGSLMTQEVLSRVMASRTGTIAVRGCFMAAIMYLFIGLMPATLGLIGFNFSLELTDQDQFIPELAKSLLSPWLYVIFCGALISAILSTVDSTLLTISAFISRNIIDVVKPNQTEKQKVRNARIVLVLAGIAAFIMALDDSSIYEKVETASAMGAPGLLAILIMGLWSKRGRAPSAIAALIVGSLAYPLLEYKMSFEAPFMMSIALSFLAFMIFINRGAQVSKL